MSNVIQEFEKHQIKELTEGRATPEFRAGDTLRVVSKIKDGATERLQAYEGVVIAKKRCGISSSFTVRKISFGMGVERMFFQYSPLIHSIKVVKRGVVRRAKLFYLRGLSSKAARIKELREHKSK